MGIGFSQASEARAVSNGVVGMADERSTARNGYTRSDRDVANRPLCARRNYMQIMRLHVADSAPARLPARSLSVDLDMVSGE